MVLATATIEKKGRMPKLAKAEVGCGAILIKTSTDPWGDMKLEWPLQAFLSLDERSLAFMTS